MGQLDVMTIKGDCTITSTYFAATATFQNVAGTSGNVIINVISIANKAGCLPLGQATCSYVSGNNVLQFNCGGSTLDYQRQ